MGRIGHEIIFLKEVDSTNRYLMDWITRERPEEGTVVVTEFQTAGRGMDGSIWESEQKKNLTFSFILYPTFLAPDGQFFLNKSISLGITDFVAMLLPGREDIRIKWPNDIYIGDSKLAGTLIQNGVKGSSFDFSIVGIGLNVNQIYFSNDALNPVSLKIVTGKELKLEEILPSLLTKIDNRYKLLRNGLRKTIDEDYLNKLYRYKLLSDFIYKDERINARINGVNRYGQLVLEIPGEKIIECDLKEIKFEI